MKVSNSGPKNVAGNTSPTATTKPARGSGNSAAAEALGATVGSSTKVDVSSRAQELKRVQELATPNKGIDEAKVARLQAMIDSGAYKVDADAIAERLVSEQLKMNENS